MKKEAIIFVFIAVAVGGYLLMRSSGDDAAAGDAPKAEVEKTEAKAAADDVILPVGSSYAQGSDKALVTIIEFSEFQCPFCARVLPTMNKIKETYGDKVRIVFKHNPLPFHKDAPLASEAALAAGEQGKFWEMHDKLFENQKKLKRADIDGYAQEIGLDMAKFKADLDSGKFKKVWEEDQKLAQKVGARGTPNFFVNGEQITGARPFDAFKTVIDKQLAEAEKLQKAGKSPSEIYAAMVKQNYQEPKKPAARKGDDSATVYKIPAGDSYFKGEKDALVTIIEFSEFQCPFCRRVKPTMKQVMEEYKGKVKVVFKHNPLPFHKDAPLAAEAALAAGEQGKFWELHDKLFENQKKLKRADIDGYAQEIGLDMAKFKADLDSGKFKKVWEDDQKLANQFGARGTPNFFINGRKLTGAQPFDRFKTVIDEEIKKAEALVKAGTPVGQVYAKLTEKGETKAVAPTPQKRGEDTTVYKVPVDADDAMKGPKDALVTIIEFSEFQCPFCAKVLPTLTQLQKDYGDDIRIVFKHNPLPFHKDAPLAAYASIAAQKQGKFWEMHDLLFANARKLKRDDLIGYAKQIGLNMSQFEKDMDDQAAKKSVTADQALARQIGAGGTPNFFINGRKLVGAQPLPSFKKVIDEELKKAKALVAKGTPKAKVYEEITKNGATKPAAPAGKGRPEEDPNKVYTVKVGPNDQFKGPKNAPITIVEFSDFQCPFCNRVNPTLAALQKKYGDKIRIVFKHNPLSFHKDAPLASQAALAAGEQGKFWEMHDLLFKNMRALKRDNLDSYAQELGLNMDKFKAALDSGKFKAQVDADIAQARSLGATGTPTFFINGKKLRGAQPQASFERVIDELLKKK